MAFGLMKNLGTMSAAPDGATPQDVGSSSGMHLNGGLGGIFSRLGGKNSPQRQTPLAPPGPGAYAPMVQGDRAALLQAMLTRARGGQAGGAPTAPLPTPNSNIPVA